MVSFKCPNCTYSTLQFKRLLCYLEYAHASDASFIVCCGIDNCFKKYKVVQSYRKHIQRKHPGFYSENVISNRTVNLTNHSNVEIQCEAPIEISSYDLECGEEILPNVQYNNDHPIAASKLRFAKFLLKLLEEKKMKKNVIKEITNEMRYQLSTCIESIQERLKENWVSSSDYCPEIANQIVSPMMELIEICESLETEHQQDNYVMDHFQVVSPVQVSLELHNHTHIQSYQYVPIANSLKQLLLYHDVLAEVLRGHKSKDGLLRDYCDGLAFKEHSLFPKEGLNLELQLYIDDFQTTNPIGNKTALHKTTAIYFVLGNISPQF